MPIPPVIIGVVAEKVLTFLWGLFSKKPRPKRKKKSKIEKHLEKSKDEPSL